MFSPTKRSLSCKSFSHGRAGGAKFLDTAVQEKSPIVPEYSERERKTDLVYKTDCVKTHLLSELDFSSFRLPQDERIKAIFLVV